MGFRRLQGSQHAVRLRNLSALRERITVREIFSVNRDKGASRIADDSREGSLYLGPCVE